MFSASQALALQGSFSPPCKELREEKMSSAKLNLGWLMHIIKRGCLR